MIARTGGVRSLSRSHEYPRRPVYRRHSPSRSHHNETEVRAAAYLHKATGKGWFVGPYGALYVFIPKGFTAHDVYSKVSHLPELRELKHYQDKLYLAPSATRRLGERLHLHASTLREYCRKVGGPHEHRFFGKSHGCDPWLASHLSRTGGSGLRSMLRNLGIRTPALTKTGGSRLKRIHQPFGDKGEQEKNEKRGGNSMCEHVHVKPNPHNLPLGFCVCLREHGVLTCHRVAGNRAHKHWVPVQNI